MIHVNLLWVGHCSTLVHCSATQSSMYNLCVLLILQVTTKGEKTIQELDPGLVGPVTMYIKLPDITCSQCVLQVTPFRLFMLQCLQDAVKQFSKFGSKSPLLKVMTFYFSGLGWQLTTGVTALMERLMAWDVALR